jgi:CSLREA domain-containing protein
MQSPNRWLVTLVAVLANLVLVPAMSARSAQGAGVAPSHPSAVALAGPSAGPSFTVDTAADTADANPGNAICADAADNCSLRAAITESNRSPGSNRIYFNLPGPAPVLIQLQAGKPNLVINDRSGGLTIDGYSQPGARVNTAPIGSNAIMGVELRGTGSDPRGNALRISSASNVIRGLLPTNHYRAIVIEGADAKNNLVVGNWLGFTKNGGLTAHRGNYHVMLSSGASNNRIGAPALADRNVIGHAVQAITLAGAGTNGNVIQNNLLCITPRGFGRALCDVAIDHNSGPKNGLIGGAAPFERNVIGPTRLQGIEYSHGWDPVTHSAGLEWQVNNNRAIGNWIGFRGDGSYDPAFRSGRSAPSSRGDGNAINLHDGANFNIIEGNHVASVYDGIQTRSPNSTGNVVRNNTVGMSPTGQAAPMAGYGIVASFRTQGHLIQANLIVNAAAGGIGLTDPAVRFVRVTQNIVRDTDGPAIFIASDPHNAAAGADGLQPPPVITSAKTTAVTGRGIVGATIELYRATRPDGQSGLPVEYLGSAVVRSNGRWAMQVSINAGTVVTALQIRPNGNTSALGTNVEASTWSHG